MLQFIFKVWNVLTQCFIWFSLIAACTVICVNIYKIAKKAKTKDKILKNIVLIVLSGSYIALFLWIGYKNFTMVFGVLFVIYAIIATQLQKYADRKSGRRWWEQ